MYGASCNKMTRTGGCADKRCLFPVLCGKMKLNHKRQTALLKKLRELKNVKGVFIGSGVRHDMILADTEHGMEYLEELIKHYISGQLKIAPEHSESGVLKRMGKPAKEILTEFRKEFNRIAKKHGKKEFLTYYLIAAHPGCELRDMKSLREFAGEELNLLPEQVQIFTPTPSTYSTLMYYTEKDPFTNERIFVEKDKLKKESQKNVITKASRQRVKEGKRRYTR